MRINEVLADLIKQAPNAVFTKGEALVKACRIIEFVMSEDEADDYEMSILDSIKLSIEHFDDNLSDVDSLLDDVKFLSFESIQNVIDNEICRKQYLQDECADQTKGVY